MTATTNATTETPAALVAAAIDATEAAGRLWLELEAAQGRAVVAWSAARNAARKAGDNATAETADKVAHRHGDALDRLRVAFFKMAGHHLGSRGPRN